MVISNMVIDIFGVNSCLLFMATNSRLDTSSFTEMYMHTQHTHKHKQITLGRVCCVQRRSDHLQNYMQASIT